MIVLVFFLAILFLIIVPFIFVKLNKSAKFEELYENLGEVSVNKKNEQGKSAKELIDEYNQKLSEIERAKKMIEERKRQIERDEELFEKATR